MIGLSFTPKTKKDDTQMPSCGESRLFQGGLSRQPKAAKNLGGPRGCEADTRHQGIGSGENPIIADKGVALQYTEAISWRIVLGEAASGRLGAYGCAGGEVADVLHLIDISARDTLTGIAEKVSRGAGRTLRKKLMES